MKIRNIGRLSHNNWIVETPGGLLAVDTGFAVDADAFYRKLEKFYGTQAPTWAFVSHAHADHAGFAQALSERSSTTLLMGASTAKFLCLGRYKSPGYEYTNALGKALVKMEAAGLGQGAKLKEGASSLLVAQRDGECFRLGATMAQVVFLPGHTQDNCGLYLPEEGILFCGDASINISPFNRPYHCLLIEDVGAFYESWEKIIRLNPAMIFSGHGKPFGPDSLQKHLGLLRR